MTRFDKIFDDTDSKGSWHWLDKSDSDSSLFGVGIEIVRFCLGL